MALAQKIHIINEGLFDASRPPDAMQQVLSIGVLEVVNWPRIRPALKILDEMSWYTLDGQWQHFLDQAQYPPGRPMKLQNKEAGLFQQMIRDVQNGTREGLRALLSVHPVVPATDFSVAFEAHDFETLKDVTSHIHEVVKHIAVDEPVKIRAVQTGSIDIAIEALGLTGDALTMAILLVAAWKKEPVDKLVRLFKRLQRKPEAEADSKEDIRKNIIEDAREEFWLKNAKLLGPGLNRKAVNTAADLIYEHSERLGVRWSLPPAVIRMLPDGIEIDINDPKFLETALRALKEPNNKQDND